MSGRSKDADGAAVSRRTRSSRSSAATLSPAPPPPPPTRTRSKRSSQKPVFEDTEDLKEMSKGLQSFLEQEDSGDFEPPLSCERSPANDSPQPHISRSFEDESNGIMDGVLKSCLEDNMMQTDNAELLSTYETSDASNSDYVNENASADYNSSETDMKKDVEMKEDAKEENSPEYETQESQPAKKEEGVEDETEVVSEDELPVVEKPEVKDAENVSDDELPGPKPADLPADTEVVSEDELPSGKKDTPDGSRKRKTGSSMDGGYDPGSPTSEGETASKKQALSKDSDGKPQAADKRSSEDKSTKKKALPELDKYWKAVNDDAADFTGWTYLLQYVDQENDVEAAREAYDAFLSHYPYCYGYWRKYADYEKRKGSKKKCLEVLERGLRGISLSVDLWIHYLNHIKATRCDDHEFIRQQYERALTACGLEFRSDRLWESFIKWESENGTLPNVTALYDRLLSTPTLGYTTHFDNFQEHIMSHAANACIPVEEFLLYRTEIRNQAKSTAVPDADADIPPGEEEADDHLRSDEESTALKEHIIMLRSKIHKNTIDQVAQRWNFEEGIKRPYFHVKPLERCQLKNWKAYLEWEEEKGDSTRILVLYERCLIACALYEEFWLRLVQYLEGQYEKAESDEEKAKLVARTRDVFERACTIHHLDKPLLHFRWAFFEEQHGNQNRAAEILERLDKTCPNLIQVAYRRINLEKRRGDVEKCCILYENYMLSSKSKVTSSSLAVKYARFLMRSKGDAIAAIKALRMAATRDPTCQRLYLQMIDITMSKPNFDLAEVIGYIDEYLAIEGIDSESRLLFSQRKLELLEEMSENISEIQTALMAYQTSLKQYHKKKKDKNDPNKKKGDGSQPPLPPSSSTTASGSVSAYGNYNAAYGYSAPPPAQSTTQQSYDNGTYPQSYQTQWTQYQQTANAYQHNAWPYQNYY